MRILVIIQARMGSSRLPGKIMKKLYDKTILEHDVDRIRQCKQIDDIIIATTTNKADNEIEEEAVRLGVHYYRGSEEDVLSRYYYAAKEYKADVIIRITSDCPLYDPKVLDEMISFYKKNQYDIVSNAGSDIVNRTYPRGLDTEIFSYNILEEAFYKAREKYQREHVTPYIYETSSKIYYYKADTDNSKYRWTLDTNEDWLAISKIYDYLYQGSHDFYLDDILLLMQKHPEIYDINKNVEQKKLK